MSNLTKILKSWRYDNRVLCSPRFPDTKSYIACKQMLVREWIKIDAIDNQRIIRIPMNPEAEPGKSNVEKLLKLKVEIS